MPIEIPDRTIVVLGGNAFARLGTPLTMGGQFRFAHDALKSLQPLLISGRQFVLTHGNGPQVGHILVRVEEALGKAYTIPLEVCVAESEGELGYVLEQSLYNLLLKYGGVRPIVSLLTQVVVDQDDPAFTNPTKPIGPFYSKDQAEELARQGHVVREDAGRGYRRVVPSPEPRRIVELSVIQQLLDGGVIVVAAGGGGIPVVEDRGRLRGVEAVIDKDGAAALLGDAIGAELMIVLTCVPFAYRNFDTDSQSPIRRVPAAEAKQLIREGHFAPGSMLPKMEAAVRFADRPGRIVVICDPPSLSAALNGTAGTVVVSDFDDEDDE